MNKARVYAFGDIAASIHKMSVPTENELEKKDTKKRVLVSKSKRFHSNEFNNCACQSVSAAS